MGDKYLTDEEVQNVFYGENADADNTKEIFRAFENGSQMVPVIIRSGPKTPPTMRDRDKIRYITRPSYKTVRAKHDGGYVFLVEFIQHLQQCLDDRGDVPVLVRNPATGAGCAVYVEDGDCLPCKHVLLSTGREISSDGIE